MTQPPVAVFKIPTESPQQAHGKASRARKAAAAQPKAATRTAGRVASSETRAATRGDGQGMTLARDLLLDQDTTLAEWFAPASLEAAMSANYLLVLADSSAL